VQPQTVNSCSPLSVTGLVRKRLKQFGAGQTGGAGVESRVPKVGVDRTLLICGNHEVAQELPFKRAKIFLHCSRVVGETPVEVLAQIYETACAGARLQKSQQAASPPLLSGV
jgi:hypothetical protein